MTALSAPEDKERGEKLGVDKYLVKSQVTLEEMVDAIKQVIASAAPATAGNEQVLGSGGQRSEAPAADNSPAPTAPTATSAQQAGDKPSEPPTPQTTEDNTPPPTAPAQ